MSEGSAVLRLVGIWFALLLLLAITVASAFIPMGHFNLVLNLLIATAKALLILVFFMHMRTGGTTVRLVASTGILWLLLLATLSLADLFTRQASIPPW